MRTTEVQLTREQAEQFYAEKADEPYFEDLMQEMIVYVDKPRDIRLKKTKANFPLVLFSVDQLWRCV